MSRSKNRKIADLISGGTFDDGVVAASEVTGLATVATSGSFNDLSNQPTPFDPSTLGTASTQATGAFATAAQGTTANAALPKAGGAVTGNVTFGDNDKIVMGAGSDLSIYHDGTNSFINDTGTGNLRIGGDTNVSITNSDNTVSYAVFNDANAVKLYYNDSKKFETTSSGIDVTGTVNADALTGIGSIDATTKNAISAAGVGGLTTVIADNVALGAGSSLSISLGNYTRQIIWIWGLAKHTLTNGKNLDGYLTDSSGSAITTNEYVAASGSYATSDYYSTDRVRLLETPDIAPVGSNNVHIKACITVDHAYSSTIRTSYDAMICTFNSSFPTGTAYTRQNSQTGIMKVIERNSSLILIPQSPSSFRSGLYYSSIGVN